MAIKDVERFKRNPTSGADAGNQAITDANIKALDRIAIPANETNTFNGGKVENGVINLSRNSDGDLVFQSYADGKWTEYLAVLDGLKSIGGITLDGNEVTVVAPIKWRINSVNYEKLVNIVITVNSATDGFKRIDYIYADTNSNILLIEGTEVADGNPYIPPTLPLNTVMVAPVYISGDTVLQPIPDLSGYLTQIQANQLYIQANPLAVQNASYDINGVAKSTNVKTGSVDIYIEGLGIIGSISHHGSGIIKYDNNAYHKFTVEGINGFTIRQNEIYRELDQKKALFEGDALPISGGEVTGKITGSSLFTVTDPKDYVQAGYIDVIGSGFVLKTGDTMTGNLLFLPDAKIKINTISSDNKSTTFIGNSITDGNPGPSPQSNRYSTVTSFQTRVIEINHGIGSSTMQKGIPVNPIGGVNMQDRLSDIPNKTDLLDCLIFEFGTNDFGWNGGNYTPEAFKDAYRNTINNAISKGWNKKDIYILTIGYINSTGFNFYASLNGGNLPTLSRLLAYRDATIEIATEFDLNVIDVYSIMSNNGGDALLHTDGVHLNNSGAKILADFLSDMILNNTSALSVNANDAISRIYIDRDCNIRYGDAGEVGSLNPRDLNMGATYSSVANNSKGAKLKLVDNNGGVFGFGVSGQAGLEYFGGAQNKHTFYGDLFIQKLNINAGGEFVAANIYGIFTAGGNKYSEINIGTSETPTASKTGKIGYYEDVSNPNNSGIYLTNHTESELTGGLFVKKGGNVRIGILSGTGYRPVSAAADGTLGIDTGGARLAGGNVFTGGHQDVRNDGDFRVFNTLSGTPNNYSTLNSGGTVLTSNDNNTTTIYGQNWMQRLNNGGFYSRLTFAASPTASREYVLPDASGSVPIVLAVGAFSHASPPTSSSVGASGSVWYDPVSKDRYDWIADNVVARYFADPTF